MKTNSARFFDMLVAIVFGAVSLLPTPTAADPVPDPPPGTVLPRTFCFRITDIRADKADPELDKFIFEFEVLNWSDVPAGGLELALAVPTPPGISFTGAGVDIDGRPLFFEDTNGDNVIDANDLEDNNGNGILDPGEDQNANGRLDNDPMPGNLGFANNWTVMSQTGTKVTWQAPEFFPGQLDGIPFINLIGAAAIGGAGSPEESFTCIPGVTEGTTTVDASGNVSPVEAIDNEDNALDGFRFTVDGLAPGVTFNVNWFLTGAGFGEAAFSAIGQFCRSTNRFGLGIGDPIGTAFEGNEFGFGVITISRVDDGTPPGPVFEGNAGVGQGPLEFFDSVYVVPDPAGMAAEFGAGLTAPFVDPADNTRGDPINAEPAPVIDTDGDGIPDDDDACPNSDLSATVVIGDCDSGVANVLMENGCTISDQIAEVAAGAGSHGQFVSGVSHLLNDLKKQGVITGRDKGSIQRCAARSSIGK